MTLKQIISDYLKGGFELVVVLADNQSDCVRGAISDLGACSNIPLADTLVPEIER